MRAGSSEALRLSNEIAMAAVVPGREACGRKGVASSFSSLSQLSLISRSVELDSGVDKAYSWQPFVLLRLLVLVADVLVLSTVVDPERR